MQQKISVDPLENVLIPKIDSAMKQARDGNNSEENCTYLTLYAIHVMSSLLSRLPFRPEIVSTGSFNGSGQYLSLKPVNLFEKNYTGITQLNIANIRVYHANTHTTFIKNSVSHPSKLNATLMEDAKNHGGIIYGDIGLTACTETATSTGHVLAFIANEKNVYYIDGHLYDGITKKGSTVFKKFVPIDGDSTGVAKINECQVYGFVGDSTPALGTVFKTTVHYIIHGCQELTSRIQLLEGVNLDIVKGLQRPTIGLRSGLRPISSQLISVLPDNVHTIILSGKIDNETLTALMRNSLKTIGVDWNEKDDLLPLRFLSGKKIFFSPAVQNAGIAELIPVDNWVILNKQTDASLIPWFKCKIVLFQNTPVELVKLISPLVREVVLNFTASGIDVVRAIPETVKVITVLYALTYDVRTVLESRYCYNKELNKWVKQQPTNVDDDSEKESKKRKTDGDTDRLGFFKSLEVVDSNDLTIKDTKLLTNN